MGIRFRRIYWVTEQLDDAGRSEVTGIFTSIPDLVERGVGIRPICDKNAGFRITLCALDSPNAPLARFGEAEFGEVEMRLAEFIETGEISTEEVATLAATLRECMKKA
ncbi:MAG: hypothetical protein HND42_10745 [Armatimonadetes bacterium]|nr:hypothetical protein [Armatimonadota bacterium]NOG93705.1 hypothetical protein [Armatimonadota bacterium]